MFTIEDLAVFDTFSRSLPRFREKRRYARPAWSVSIDGHSVCLTRTEYRLLAIMASRPGKTISCAQLHKEVFADHPAKSTHHLRMYIHLLRRRIEINPRQPRFLLTVRKGGYRLALAPHHALGEMYFTSLSVPPVSAASRRARTK